MHRIGLVILLFLPNLLWSTEIYRSVDDRGNPVFSDQPSKHAVPVDIQELNTTPGVDVPKRSDPPPAATSEDTPQLTIRQPRNGQILANGLQATPVNIGLSKDLPPGYRIRITLDGAELQSGRSTSLTIPRLDRGPHQISASLMNQHGATIQQESINIMVYWPNN